MLALRQCLGAAVRWQYLGRNPAKDAGPNPEPGAEEIKPFTIVESTWSPPNSGRSTGR
jgi:hypothetical protein